METLEGSEPRGETQILRLLVESVCLKSVRLKLLTSAKIAEILLSSYVYLLILISYFQLYLYTNHLKSTCLQTLAARNMRSMRSLDLNTW